MHFYLPFNGNKTINSSQLNYIFSLIYDYYGHAVHMAHFKGNGNEISELTYFCLCIIDTPLLVSFMN